MVIKVEVTAAGKDAIIVEKLTGNVKSLKIEWLPYRSFATHEEAEAWLRGMPNNFRIKEPMEARKTGRAKLMKVTNK